MAGPSRARYEGRGIDGAWTPTTSTAPSRYGVKGQGERDLDVWEQRVALAAPTYATGDVPFFNFVPPQRGTRIEATVEERLGETRELEKVEGMLDVTVDRTLPWARLIAAGTLFPASYVRVECAFTLRHSVVTRRAPTRGAAEERPGARAG